MLHKILQRVLWLFIRTLISTYKLEIQGKENYDKAVAMNPDKSLIFTLWHEDVVSGMVNHAWTKPFAVLSSKSKDGDYAAYISKKMGFTPVRGSSRKKNKDKGGSEAIQLFVTNLKAGNSIGLTVDGPKGPRQVCKIGAALVAQKTGAPILPMIGKSSSHWVFNSWDQFKLPKPFAKLTVVYAEPIMVPASATPEELEGYCQKVGDSMKRLAAL